MAENIEIRSAEGTWVVRAGGAVLGESDKALELREEGYDPVIYFPREDIAMAFLDASETRTTCPHKGEARYFTIQSKSGPLTDAAWCYEDPKDGVSRIAGHLAFYTDTVAVEQV
ncbi:DUF427 domain-containing protein [Histidinibacterium aquaticum]|uniref:DUF427 domain-containing protein n=1 Tax=Histidinibacterium aquaticum TaxID=2613962 RepID=A0A5J5GIH1_9RHOB|nr:DUF427 domain-containing protein [Histidinibacterium aquaticum]KAA9007917.1 DUF427 domain-containing protein [Histidinibacterium aquaticum]